MSLAARLSYANVAATLALFFALSGTAFAGAQLFVSGANVKNHSLTGVDIRKGSLGLKTLSPAARSKLKGATGPVGATGLRALREARAQPVHRVRQVRRARLDHRGQPASASPPQQ